MHLLSLSSLRHVSGEDGGREVSSPFDDMCVTICGRIDIIFLCWRSLIYSMLYWFAA